MALPCNIAVIGIKDNKLNHICRPHPFGRSVLWPRSSVHGDCCRWLFRSWIL